MDTDGAEANPRQRYGRQPDRRHDWRDCVGIALDIEMGADAVDIGKTIHPPPTLGKSIGVAEKAAHGSCTDLPPIRK